MGVVKLALKEDVLGLERQLGLAIQILDISLTTHSLASQTRNTLLLVRKLDSLPSTDNQVAVVSSGSSLTLTSARRHAPVKNDRAGRSILPPGQVNAWLLDHGIFGPLAIVVQNLAMKPEIAISRYPAWAQQEWDEVLEGAAQMEGSTKTPVKNDYASTRAMELCQ